MSSLHQLERSMVEVIQTLYELGITIGEVQEGSRDVIPGLIQDLVRLLAQCQLEDDNPLSRLEIPLEVFSLVDAGRNPHYYSRSFTEQVVGENAWSHAKLQALHGLREALVEEMEKEGLSGLAK